MLCILCSDNIILHSILQLNFVFYKFSRLGQCTASEQLLSASSSAAGDMIQSELHELSSLTSNSIVKQATALETRPINFDRAFKNRFLSYPTDNSPTSASAITEVLPDDCDADHLQY